MDSEKRAKKRENSPDWRNTLYQFHTVAVPKFALTSQEIAVFTSLLSAVKSNGRTQRSNADLMQASGIGNERTFIKARNRLVEVGILSVVERGVAKRKNTTYKVKLIGAPKKEGQKMGKQLGAKVPAIDVL